MRLKQLEEVKRLEDMSKAPQGDFMMDDRSDLEDDFEVEPKIGGI